jgi:hypothetical protein
LCCVDYVNLTWKEVNILKFIPLTQGKVALVDDENYEWLMGYRWHAMKVKNLWYAARSTATPRKVYLMHIEIVGKKPGLISDHIDGNGLNCQKHNLRHVTRRQNSQNRHHKKTSRYPGVDFHCKKWRAAIYSDGKCNYLGHFNTEKKAFTAYRKAVESLGERVISC